MFQVLWSPNALEELAAVWMELEDRQSVTDASDQIDERLKQNPQDVGESRTGSLRITFDNPLGLIFNVSDADRRVTVLSVWSI
jgi:hypothetical protein